MPTLFINHLSFCEITELRAGPERQPGPELQLNCYRTQPGLIENQGDYDLTGRVVNLATAFNR